MNSEGRYKILYEEINKHMKRLRSAFDNLKNEVGFPLDGATVENILKDDKLVPFLDQIAYRFSKIQDNLGKLIRMYMFLKGENVENLTMIDVLNLSERYKLGINKEKWFELRGLRNLIVNEYESQTEKIAEIINRIYNELSYLKGLLDKLRLR